MNFCNPDAVAEIYKWPMKNEEVKPKETKN